MDSTTTFFLLSCLTAFFAVVGVDARRKRRIFLRGHK